jgi:acetyltransferase-like isoleucine patch superfamily enzyme
MKSQLTKIGALFTKNDFRFYLYQKWSLFVGVCTTKISTVIYGRRLKITKPYSIWGNIRFLMLGAGCISIGRNFHAVSAKKRSLFTLFSPCHLTIIGDGRIEIGKNVGLNGTTIASRERISIGDYTMIGPNTFILDHDGHSAWPPRDRWTTSGTSAPVVIGQDVWIGMNCIILKGVTIGCGSIIAAGSVVIKDVEPNSLYAGNPAVKVKSLNHQETKHACG